MNFIQSLKKTAAEIITITDECPKDVKTWDQSPGAPAGGYDDRAGFLIDSDIELYADVALIENNEKGLLRARAAKVTTAGKNETFNIVTLDFTTDSSGAAEFIQNKGSLTQQKLIDLLNQDVTQPKLIHVSLETGGEEGGQSTGVRYEYNQSDLASTTPEQQSLFVDTVKETLQKIFSSHNKATP